MAFGGVATTFVYLGVLSPLVPGAVTSLNRRGRGLTPSCQPATEVLGVGRGWLVAGRCTRCGIMPWLPVWARLARAYAALCAVFVIGPQSPGSWMVSAAHHRAPAPLPSQYEPSGSSPRLNRDAEQLA